MVTWWIDGDDEELARAVMNAGHTCIHSRFACWEKPDYAERLGSGPVVRYGSIQFCQDFDRRSGIFYVPSVTERNYQCSMYYPEFGDVLFNSNYAMYPFGELGRLKERLFEKYGVDDTIYIRPNSGLKVFTGQTVNYESYSKDLKLIGFYEVPSDTLVLVSNPKGIKWEIRYVVCNGKVITGSYYKIDGQYTEVNADDKLQDAQSIVDSANWQPDGVWCLDLCNDGDQTYVLEIGAFAYCGLYKCDRDKIVEAVSKFAEEEYGEYEES